MTEKTLLISLLLAFCFGQSDFQKGVTHYNKRHEGCIEDRAKPMQIEMAITYFENDNSKKRLMIINIQLTLMLSKKSLTSLSFISF